MPQTGGTDSMGDVVSNEKVALEAVRYDAVTGMVPVVVQDVATSTVLMLAYANREALKRTLDTGLAWFWSRSRKTYWCKGATSGNTQSVKEVRLDCDGDTVLYLVDPAGPACHTGETSCFHRSIERQALTQAKPEAVSSAGPSAVVQSSSDSQRNLMTLNQLWKTISQRYAEQPSGSYTTYLFKSGVDKVAKKVGEEATEVVIAGKNAAWNGAEGRAELTAESADLLFHLMVLWRQTGVNPEDVFGVLEERAK